MSSNATSRDADRPVRSSRIPDALVRAGVSGKLSILVGAGASRDSGLPGWDKLLDDLYERAHESLARATVNSQDKRRDLNSAQEWRKKNADLILAASMLRGSMGDPWLRDAIIEIFSDASPNPTETHEMLARLEASCRFLTTNYDQLLERAVKERSGRSLKVVTPRDLEAIAAFDAHAIFKLHGDVGRPETIVLTVADYERLIHEEPSAWRERLKALVQEGPLLLVGYSYRDPDIADVVGELNAAYGGHLQSVYWLEKADFVAETWAEAHGIQLVEGISDYSEILPWLKDLVCQIEEARKKNPLVLSVQAYQDVSFKGFEKGDDEARKLFDSYAYDDARQRYQEMLADAKKLLASDATNSDLRSWVARLGLKVGRCSLCLQDTDLTRTQLASVDADAFDKAEEWVQLIQGLAQVGEIDRAKELLSRARTLFGDASVVSARQLLDILEGRFFEDPISDPWLRTKYGWLLIERGDIATCADVALATMASVDRSPLLIAETMAVLVHGLERTLRQMPPPPHPIAVAKRWDVIQAIEEAIENIKGMNLPPALSELVFRESVLFFELTRDAERVSLAERRMAEHGEAMPYSDPAVTRAFELCHEGRLDEALKALPHDDHPWLDELREAAIWICHGQSEPALKLLTRLAERGEGEADVAFAFAGLLFSLGRIPEALPHARRAFEELPGRGQRLLLARCLVSGGAVAESTHDALEEAWELLRPLEQSRSSEVLQLRAQIASRLANGQASALWRKLLGQNHGLDESALRGQLIQSLHRERQRDEAAEEAWALFESGSETLSIETLGLIGEVLQFRSHPLRRQERDRLIAVAKVVQARTASDVRAEVLYVSLYEALGSPAEMAPIDFDHLAEVGVAKKIDSAELQALMERGQKKRDAAGQLYRTGRLTFEAFRELVELPPAFLLERAISAPRRRSMVLSTPVNLRSKDAITLQDKTILCGEMELLLLEELGLLDTLRRSLGPEGSVAIFDDRLEAIETQVLELRRSAQGERLKRMERLLGFIESNVFRDSHEEASLEKASIAKTKVWVSESRPSGDIPWLSVRSLIEHLQASGMVDGAKAEALASKLPSGPTIDDIAKAYLIVDYGSLMRLDHLDAIETMLDAEWRFEVDPKALDALKHDIAELKVYDRAARRAVALQDWIAEGIPGGWVRVLSRPSRVRGLPQAKAPYEGTPIENMVHRVLSSYQAVEDLDQGLLLTADFLVASVFSGATPIDIFAPFAWTRESYRAMRERIRVLDVRRLGLPALVRALLFEAADGRLADLARFGFFRALDAKMLLTVSHRYGGFEGERLRTILDGMEWMARQTAHSGARLAHLALSTLYAETISRAWRRGEGSEEQSVTVTRTLLERMELLDRETEPGGLEQMFRLIAADAVDHPGDSFVSGEREGLLELSQDSRLGRLWRQVNRWAMANRSRLGSLRRAVLGIFCFLDQTAGEEGPTDVSVHSLMLAAAAQPRDAGLGHGDEQVQLVALQSSVESDRAFLDAVATLSSNWAVRPLEKVIVSIGTEEGLAKDFTYEALCELGAKTIRDRVPGLEGDAFDLRIPLRLGEQDEIDVQQTVPIDAVLLRMLDDDSEDLLSDVQGELGFHDGKLQGLLETLKKTPGNRDARRTFARASAQSPARWVRQDPLWILTWRMGSVNTEGTPRQLDELRQLLSEPLGPLPEKLSLQNILEERLAEGGAWHGRRDVKKLLRLACTVPGDLPVHAIPLLLDGKSDETEIRHALLRLRESQGVTVGQIMTDIVFLRVSAARKPLVKIEGRTVDLRERFSEVISDLLAREGELGDGDPLNEGDEPRLSSRSPQPKLTLAAMEATLLRHCGRVVHHLSRLDMGGRTFEEPGATSRDRLWLAWRLYQWLVVQLASLAPDDRQEALARFRDRESTEPRQDEAGIDDLLDPGGFGPGGFRHRIAAVLYSLHLGMTASVTLAVQAGKDGGDVEDISSRRLETLLVGLARQQPSKRERRFSKTAERPVSRLEWHGAASVPELALLALLTSNAEAFLDLPQKERMRWFSRLPGENKKTTLSPWSIKVLLGAVARYADRLSKAEHALLKDTLLVIENQDTKPDLGDIVLLALLGLARVPESDVETRIEALLDRRRSREDFWPFVGHYFGALTFHGIQTLEAAFRRYQALVEDGDDGTLPLITALANAMFSGKREAVTDVAALLRRVVKMPPFADNADVASLMAKLGLVKD